MRRLIALFTVLCLTLPMAVDPVNAAIVAEIAGSAPSAHGAKDNEE